MDAQSPIDLDIKFEHPWIVLVRICTLSIPSPSQVKNVRIRSIDKSTILILWNDYEYPVFERCIQSYEIYFASAEQHKHNNHRELQWQIITQNKHIPFLSYCHHVTPNQRLNGIFHLFAYY